MTLKTLAQIPLKQFSAKSPGRTYLGPWIKEVLLQIKRDHGISFKPHFFFGDEWFYADGTHSISIPYYLQNKEFSKIVQRSKFQSEGHSKRAFQKLLRHELGHYFEALYSTRRWKLRRSLFGAKPATSNSYLPYQDPSEYVSHLPHHYAQSHPDEDFAETFAVFVKPGGDWKVTYAKTKALKKLVGMGLIISLARTKKQRDLDKRKLSFFGKSTLKISDLLDKDSTDFQRFSLSPCSRATTRLSSRHKICKTEALYLAKTLSWRQRELKRSGQKISSDDLVKQILKTKSHYIPY